MKRFLHKTNSDHQTSMEIGYLYPIQCLDVMAGQTTWLNTSALCRFQPMIAPAFIKMNMHIAYFYVPYRLLWDQWNDFITGQEKLELPTGFLKMGDFGFDHLTWEIKKSLFDFFGFPTHWDQNTFEMNFNILPFLAYHMIWNDHFRDPNLQAELDIPQMFNDMKLGIYVHAGGVDLNALNKKFNDLYALRRVNWGRDRFTKALLETEADPQINLPVGSDGTAFGWESMDGRFSGTTSAVFVGNSGARGGLQMNPAPNQDNVSLKYKSGLQGVSLSDFKLASAMYNFQVNQNKYGRDVEAYFRKYGLRNMDLRLNRSEVIGGFAETMQISDIIATDGQDLGKQGGHAVGYAKKRAFKHYAPEHGMIFTMAYLRPKANYAGGISRHFLKRDMLDFYQKEFENIGYQPIYKPEVGISNATSSIPVDETKMEVFGYEPRYQEYRSEQSQVSAELRPGEPLAHWSNPRHWDAPPSLNENFIQCNPSNQIWASPNTDKAIVYFKRNVTKKCFLAPSSDPKIKL